MADTTIFKDRREANEACERANATREDFLAGRFFVFEKHGFFLKFAPRGECRDGCPCQGSAPSTLNAEIAAFLIRNRKGA